LEKRRRKLSEKKSYNNIHTIIKIKKNKKKNKKNKYSEKKT